MANEYRKFRNDKDKYTSLEILLRNNGLTNKHICIFQENINNLEEIFETTELYRICSISYTIFMIVISIEFNNKKMNKENFRYRTNNSSDNYDPEQLIKIKNNINFYKIFDMILENTERVYKC